MGDEVGNRVNDLVVQVQRWTAASNRLFALGAVDDVAYMDAVRLVGLAMQHLRDHCSTVENLAAAGADLRSLLERAIREDAPATPMDLDLIVDAARGVRYGEIAASAAQAPSHRDPGGSPEGDPEGDRQGVAEGKSDGGPDGDEASSTAKGL